MAMMSAGAKRASADFAKWGFSERKFSGRQWMLVKLQRPPPEIRIFLPTRSAWSSNTTRRPRRPASSAHIIPAAPAPRTTTSTFCTHPHSSSLILTHSHLRRFLIHDGMIAGSGWLCDHGFMFKRVEERGPRVVAAQPFGPAAGVTRRAADRLRAGHLWVYRSDVESLVPPMGASEVAGGALVTVADNRGIPLGTALDSEAPQIALRLVASEAGLTRSADIELLRPRIE